MFNHSFAQSEAAFAKIPAMETDASLNWMYSQSMDIRRHEVAWGSATILGIALSVSGCASQGPLKPPSLELPKPAEKLVAERVGDQVELTWTTPTTTTDGVRSKGSITARVCLDSQPSNGASNAPTPRKKNSGASIPTASTGTCNAVLNLPVTPGVSRASTPLPPALAAGSPRVIAYAIELVSAKGKSAGPSEPVLLAAGAAPPATGPLKLSPRRQSIAIEWQPDPAAAVVELKRTLVATAAGPAIDVSKLKRQKSLSPFAPASKESAREVVLRPDAVQKDVGGVIDTTVRDGDTYTYVAQRIATVTFGSQKLELRSLPSPVATLTFHDTFPPMAPTGLVLIPGGGFSEQPSIDLSWDANFETDILGYSIYRSSGAGFSKLNPEPVAVPAFRDTHVERGQRYTYRVTAVDKRQNESVPGATAMETLRK